MEKSPEAKKGKAPEEKEQGLVAVEMAGETIHIHPTQVEQHQDLGWKIKE